jgi:hypothetical protein
MGGYFINNYINHDGVVLAIAAIAFHRICLGWVSTLTILGEQVMTNRERKVYPYLVADCKPGW